MQIPVHASRRFLAAGAGLALSVALVGAAREQGTTQPPPTQPPPTFPQWQTFPQTGGGSPIRVRTQRYPRYRNNRGRQQNRNAGAKTAHINAHDKAPVDLASSVQALKERHVTAAGKLPVLWRADERRALPVVEQLPLVAQEAYLLTIEDYPNLEVTMQGKVGDVIRSLGEIPPEKQVPYVTAATKAFDALGSDAKKLAAARKTPHETCFQLTHELPVTATPGR